FPVAGASGQLLPYFVAIRNGDEQHHDIVRHGNEHVLGARFADANFFVREDLKQSLESYRPKLSTLTFQTKLGSMLEKSERILQLAGTLAHMLGLDEAQAATVQRAAYLAKADLVTQMVTEMTSLQGIMGREYALRSGEPEAVARAIGEQYLPVPQSLAGVVVALADRIDSLVGLFAVGLAPTGAKDPFGLRRAAIGTVQPLIEHGLDFDLRAAVQAAAALQPVAVNEEVKAQVLDFMAGRLSVLLKETYRYDVVDAVLAAQSNNPAGAARAVRDLQAWVERPNWHEILPGYARCVRILRSQPDEAGSWQVDASRLIEAEEQKLYEMLQTVEAHPATITAFLEAVVTLIPSINAFFDKVLVMAEDEQVRANRLALVGQVAHLSNSLADLSKLEGF
ncbi:MAG: glycine--tRNA ligase subunit beta, partial [Anaerolineales bacterium]